MKIELMVAFLLLGIVLVEWYVFLAYRKLRKENEYLKIKLSAVESVFMDRILKLKDKLLDTELYFTEKSELIKIKQDILNLKIRAITDAMIDTITSEPPSEENDEEESLALCEYERDI